MPTVTPSSTRPHAARLAFVLGSGGVRSIAALGIASRLAREGIRPDLVVGCSSGALFGALAVIPTALTGGLTLTPTPIIEHIRASIAGGKFVVSRMLMVCTT